MIEPLKIFKYDDNVNIANFLQDDEEYYYKTYKLSSGEDVYLKLHYQKQRDNTEYRYYCLGCPLYDYFCRGINHNSYIKKIINKNSKEYEQLEMFARYAQI